MSQLNVSNIINGYQRKLRKQMRNSVKEYKKKEDSWQYIEISFTLLVVFIFAVFAIRPTVMTISGLLGEIKEKEEINAKMSKKINQVLLAQEQYAHAQERVYLLDSFLPTNPGFSQGLTQIIGVVNQSNVSISGLGLSEVNMIGRPKKVQRKGIKTDPNLFDLSISLGGETQYTDARNLLANILNLRRLVQVDSFNIGIASDNKNKDPTETRASSLHMSVMCRLNYWLPVEVAE